MGLYRLRPWAQGPGPLYRPVQAHTGQAQAWIYVYCPLNKGLSEGPGQAGQPGQGPQKPLDLMGICSDFKARTGIYGLKGPFPGLSPWAQGPEPIWACTGLYGLAQAWIYVYCPLNKGLSEGPGQAGQSGQPGQGPQKPLDLMGICSDFPACTGPYRPKGPFPGLGPGPGPWAQAWGPGPRRPLI